MTRTVTAMPQTERATLIREAFRLEYFTLAWMVIEAGVAIGAGLTARSITLLAFAIDSLIELASAGVLIWRLTVELRRGQSFAEPAERLSRTDWRRPLVCSRRLCGGGGRMGPMDR
jgi:hypothetical protein